MAKTALRILLAIKLIFIIVRLPAQFTHPHIIRQVDTMSVTLRYWLRWAVEDTDFSAFLPAVLNSGNGRGIQAMEFPLYNILVAPVFALGIDWGRPAAQLVSVVLMLVLTYFAYRIWRRIELFGDVDWEVVFLLILLASIGGRYFYRFMPDYLAFILVLIGVGFALEIPSRRNLAFSFVTLGLLIKPPVVVVFAVLLFLRPLKKVASHLWYVIPAAILCGMYYTVGISALREASDVPYYFKVALSNPFQNLLSFLMNFPGIGELFIEHFFGPFLSVLLVISLVWMVKSKSVDVARVGLLFLLFLLQVIFVALLDGDHAFIHEYYFIGTSFIAALIAAIILKSAPKKLAVLYFIVLALGSIEKMFYEIRPLWQDQDYLACREIKKRQSDVPWGVGANFRSSSDQIPYLGLCFGEKQGAQLAEYGFFRTSEMIPADCRILQVEHGVQLVSCGM